jgi:hypothetical protein
MSGYWLRDATAELARADCQAAAIHQELAMPHDYIAADRVVVVRSGGRCPHCLGAIREVLVGQPGEWLPVELVGSHYEIHDCQPRAWYAAPASQPVE